MSDPETRLTIDVLSELQGCSHWMDQNLEHLLLLRMANLSMQHGNTDASTVAYAYLGLVVGVRFGQYAAAYRLVCWRSTSSTRRASIEPNARVLGRRGMGRAVGAAPAGGSAGAPPIAGIV